VSIALVFSLVFALASTQLASAASLVQLSTDPYTNTTSQHQTEVEPDTFSSGSTIVSAFQVGRFEDGGASNIGFATSNDNGVTWTQGFLPGITRIENPSNPYDRGSDASVAFDAKHNAWLISTLAITATAGNVNGVAVVTSRSADNGLTWSNPVVVNSGGNVDKNWIVCDDTASSPHFGNCYSEWDIPGTRIQMSTSTDGGLTWGSALSTANRAGGIGGQPVVQPNGNVVVPIDNASATSVLAFTSTNGGTSWSRTVTVASISSHVEAGSLRSEPLPSAEIDGSGKVYVVWSDCRFESGCAANDLVMSTSTNGTSWSAVQRIPTDPVGSGIDHFIPGLAVDKTTSGTTAHLVVTYYYYPRSNCTSTTCQLDVGYSSSTNGGASWTAATQLAGPISLSWLPNTTDGRMVGDYISTSFTGNGVAIPVFANASSPNNSADCSSAGAVCHEAMFTVAQGLAVRSGTNSSVHDRVVTTSSQHVSLADVTAQ
jgi:hypothetical protein